MQPREGSRFATVVTLLCLGMIALLSWNRNGEQETLVVYCSHDSTYSEAILRDFERESGIRLIVRFDTEATKSIGLINLLIAERDNPQCDVFWNNEVLGTIKLQKLGMLQPYKGKGYERIPAQHKADDGSWAGFAARLRVFIVNTENMVATRQEIYRRLNANGENALARVAMAKPMFGTTLTQYTASWGDFGGEAVKRRHRRQHDRGLLEVNGNSVVKDLVASGRCDFGWTDTDDFFLAVDEDKPVDMVPVLLRCERAICIPNSVSIIRGTRRLGAAQRLVNFLLSREVETRLACSPSRQIPLGPVDFAGLPEEVQDLKRWSERSVDLKPLVDAHTDCLTWLQSEYLR